MMTVRLDKGVAPAPVDCESGLMSDPSDGVDGPPQRAGASRPVSLRKPGQTPGDAGKDHMETRTAPSRVLPPVPDQAERPGPAGPVSVRRRFGRLALIGAFTVGVMLAGVVGNAVVASRNTDLAHTRAQLASSNKSVSVLRGQLKDTTRRLDSTRSELDSTSSQLTELQSQADDVAARASRVRDQTAQLVQRSKSLDKREKALSAREASVQAREDALASPEVGHPLLEEISDDGTWVVGRDIKPGTWTALAEDTGCSWRTSDGRSGAGDGSYHEMRVHLETGQSFTVHGCSLWSNWGY